MWLALIAFSGLLGIWRLVMVKGGRLGFWQVAANRPVEALDWFENHPETWIVVERGNPGVSELKARQELVGPFRFSSPKTGSPLAVFADASRIDDSQDGFLERYGTSRERGSSWVSSVSLLYPLAAVLSFGTTEAPFTAILGFGLANLGYLLLASGVVAGHFRALGLNYRLPTLVAAITSWVLGTLLTNL